MKNTIQFFFILLALSLWSCENEVDINSDFEEVTVIYGLLDHNSDTQFVKINKTFLDDEKNALELANDPDRLFYDSLTVSLIEESSGNETFLSPIQVAKEPGLFTGEKNTIYFTDQTIEPNKNYSLKVVKPDGSVSNGRTKTVDTVFVKRPNINFNRVNEVLFADEDGSILRYRFEFETGTNVAEFEINAYFKYIEIIGADSFPRRVKIPLTRRTNPTLEPFKTFQFNFEGLQFFRAIEAQVPASLNPTKKVIEGRDNFEIEILAADEDYSFYRELNGPIDGLAQTRPEFTNITNGVGIFASRLNLIARSKISDATRIYIIGQYRDTRNFSFP